MCLPIRTILTSVAALLCGVGCNNSRPATAGRADLPALVGHQVHLEGRFGGPGKLADFVEVSGKPIYLTGAINLDGDRPKYGSIITVDGTLGHHDVAHAPQELHASSIPDHYFVNNAKVHVLRQPDAPP